MELLIIIFVIIACSVIQSVMGIGLLLFGTPTFLLLGFSFIDTLNIVLLPSIAISFLQIIDFKDSRNREINQFQKNFLLICLPALCVGLLIMSYNYELINFKYFIGILLLSVALVRLSNKIDTIIKKNINRIKIPYFLSIGIVHGLTNLGGSFLSLYASTIFANSKENTRYTIAFSYFLMGLIQFVYIQIIHKPPLDKFLLLYMIISILVFKILGNKIFLSINNILFHKLITIAILIYSFILLFN